MRNLLVGILWLTLLALWGHYRRPPDPLPPLRRPSSATPAPKPLPPPEAIPDTLPSSTPPAIPTSPSPPNFTKLLNEKALAVAELDYARQLAERMQDDLGRLEEQMIDLIRHHHACSRGSAPVGLLRGLDAFSQAEKEFIEQIWKSRDAEAGYYRERELEVEKRYQDLILGSLTPEQRRTYLVLEGLGFRREGR